MTLAEPGPRVAIDAHVVGRRKTGNETYVVNLVQALSRRDDVHPLVYLDRGVSWPLDRPPEIRWLRVRAPYLRVPVELPYRARRDRAELLHVQYVAPPLARLPIVTAIHDLSFEDVSGLFSRPTELRLKLTVRLSARKSAALITISEFTRSRISHHYGIDPDRIVVTYLGVDPFWRPLGEVEARNALSQLDLPALSVLAVGNVHPRKNIPRLIRAVANARSGGVGDLHLVLAGQRAWKATDVDREIDAVDGRGWIHELGYVDSETLRALYSAASVVAYPSRYEGFGLPALEALACGAVLVASNATAIPEVVGSAGILVDPEDDRSLEQGLARGVTDEELRQRLRAAGPARAAQFTWEACAERTMVAYRLALGR